MGIFTRAEDLTLGCVGKDKITGLTGIVIAITEWLNGCRRITIQPQKLREGVPLGAQTFDAEQVEVVKPEPKSSVKPTGGPSITPSRSADPV